MLRPSKVDCRAFHIPTSQRDKSIKEQEIGKAVGVVLMVSGCQQKCVVLQTSVMPQDSSGFKFLYKISHH